MAEVLGLSLEFESATDGQDGKLVGDLMNILLALRQSARERKDWAMSDAIRKSLQAAGIVVEDSPQGASWKKA